MFRYYLGIIFGGMTALFLIALLVGGIAPLQALLGVIVAVGTAFLLDALVAILTRLLPAGIFDPFAKRFRVRKGERGFYVRIGIRRWKDKIPETGALLGYLSKKQVTDRKDNIYLLHFMRETCYAEFMHVFSIPAGFLILLLAPLFPFPYIAYFALPVAVINACLQLLPILVQRYVRPFLLHAYQRNEAKQSRNA